MGDCYLNAGLYSDAIHYYTEAEKRSVSLGNSIETVRLFMNIGRSYMANNDTDQAVAY